MEDKYVKIFYLKWSYDIFMTIFTFLINWYLICRDGEDLLELIAGMQSKRMDEQRVTLPYLPGLNTNQDADDSFIEMLVRCQVDNFN